MCGDCVFSSRHCCVTTNMLSALLPLRPFLYHNKGIVCIVAVQVAPASSVHCLRYCCPRRRCILCQVTMQEAEKCAVCIDSVSFVAVLCLLAKSSCQEVKKLMHRTAVCCMHVSCCKLTFCNMVLSHALAWRQGACVWHVTNDCM